MEVGVWVPAWQNLLGGFAMTLLVLTIGCWSSHPADLNGGLEVVARLLPVAAAAGVIVFCLAQLVRSFRDEVSYLVACWAERRNREVERAQALRIKMLEEEKAELAKEGQLGSRYAVYKTVELMLTWWSGGLQAGEVQRKLSRRECDVALHVRRVEWEAATDVLRKAGVVGDNGQVLSADYATAWSAVIRHMQASRTFVRTADGDFAQV
jgi:hypothetical protein